MPASSRILVTGASGFIGGRLVEMLARRGHRIRIVSADLRHCARVARFPVEMVNASLLDPQAFARAVEGCDTIFHAAYRFGGTRAEQRRANVDGTRALAEAALAHGIRRFVHFSSVAAYGPPIDGELTETSRTRPARDSYTDTKQRIDRMLRELHARRRLPVTILQPTIVYGPYGGIWTTWLLQQVTSGHVMLPASQAGLCNAVYVDDVVNAALLASESDAALGESFLISGAAPVTWRTFYGAYEQMAGKRAVVLMDDAQLRAESRRANTPPGIIDTLRRALARRPELRERLLAMPPQRWVIRGGQLLLPAPVQRTLRRWDNRWWQIPPPARNAVHVPDPDTLTLYSARTHVRIDKARTMLGFVPEYDLERGMERTAAWAQWANLVAPAGR